MRAVTSTRSGIALLACLSLIVGVWVGVERDGNFSASLEEAPAECREEEEGGWKSWEIEESGEREAEESGEREPPCGERPGLPESFTELAIANSTRASRDVAPGTEIRTGAYRSAVREKASLPRAKGRWRPFGKTPLDTTRTKYDVTNGSTRLGLGGVSGRVNALARGAGRIFVGATEGGVWASTDGGEHWVSIGDRLPTQTVSGLAWSRARGGTLLVLTGDRSFGGGTKSGLGAYYTTDLGRRWKHARGIPDGLLGFRLAVDPTNRREVYAATGGGLYRSTDGGRSYVNTKLPTGAGESPNCSGKPITVDGCGLANMVTDVVVQGKANPKSKGGDPGAVLAAVGWRAGNAPNEDGEPQSPGNGLYRSRTGAPGTFENLEFADNALPKTDPLTQARIGRIALGVATGPRQDHRVVYAIVQDAVKFNGGITGLDVNEYGSTNVLQSDYLNGVWASTDFGSTWRQLEGATTIDADISSGSALSPPVCKAPAVFSYCPGIQAWFNLVIAPDPTRQTAAGIPTRLVFGLEELWEMATPIGLDGVLGVKADVIGRYFAGEACTLLNATNGLPICPAAPGGTVPKTTTHPDQHALLWVPRGERGVELFAGNDGGVYSQVAGDEGELGNDGWGRGSNKGLRTLQAYDVAVARDGTAYLGMQDNGEGKFEPDGTGYTIFGGDGFFTAVDPDDSEIAYEEYVGGTVSVTEDGGKHWSDINPGLINPAFSTPLEMDPRDARHLIIAGCDVRETTAGTSTLPGGGTETENWRTVFELGTHDTPGGACPANPLPVDSGEIVNQASAVDVLSHPAPNENLPTGPKTPGFKYSAGGATVPGLGDPTGTDTFLPGTYDDHPFTIGREDGNASVTVEVTWADEGNDWDLYLYRRQEGALRRIDSSASGGTREEKVTVLDPKPGRYVIRVVNWLAAGTFDVAVSFERRTSSAGSSAEGAPSYAYVGWCGYCDTITQGLPFNSGIATNVGGKKRGVAGTGAGWHIARAKGLPDRFVTSVRMDPEDPRTVYVTLGGYARKWAAPGIVGDDVSKIGRGHVFKSINAGRSFENISGNLPDTPANWSVLHKGHLVVGTDLGVFESCNSSGGKYFVLGRGMPNVQVSTLVFQPGKPNRLWASTYGRGLYKIRLRSDPACPGR